MRGESNGCKGVSSNMGLMAYAKDEIFLVLGDGTSCSKGLHLCERNMARVVARMLGSLVSELPNESMKEGRLGLWPVSIAKGVDQTQYEWGNWCGQRAWTRLYVLRSNKGKVLATFAVRIKGLSDAFYGESLASLEGLKLTVDFGLQQLCLEMDANTVFQAF